MCHPRKEKARVSSTLALAFPFIGLAVEANKLCPSPYLCVKA
jgi:hypothetical protein